MASLEAVVVCGHCGDWFGDFSSYEDHSLQHIPTAHMAAIKGSGSSLSHVTKARDACTANRCSRRTHGECTNSFVSTRCGAHVQLEVDRERPSAVLDMYDGGCGPDVLIVPDNGANDDDVDVTYCIDDVMLATIEGSGIREPAKEHVSAYYNPDCVGSGLRHDGYGHEWYAYSEKPCRSDGNNARYGNDVQRQNCRVYNDMSSELYSLMHYRVPDHSFPVAGCKESGYGVKESGSGVKESGTGVKESGSGVKESGSGVVPDEKTIVGYTYDTPSIPNVSTNSTGTQDVCRGIYPYLPYSQENDSSFRGRDILDDYLENSDSFTAENGVFMTSGDGTSRVTSASAAFRHTLQDLGKSVSNKEVIDNDHGEHLITSDHAYPVDDHENRLYDRAHPVDDREQVDEYAYQVDDQSQIENPDVDASPEVTKSSRTIKAGTRLDLYQEAATAHAGSEYDVRYDGFSLCHVCGRTLLSGYAMRRHLWNHEKPRNGWKRANVKSKCELCGKTYSSKSSLMRHVKVIHLGYRISCSECVQTFGTLPSLKRHRKIHARVKATQNMLSLL